MFKRAAFLLLMWSCFALSAFGQSTAVSGTITDASGQTWNSGTYTFTFYPSPINPLGPYFWNGAPFNTGQQFTGGLTNTGQISVSIPSNTAITPNGSQWSVTVCPAATASCYTRILPITGSSLVISGLVIPPALSVNAQNTSLISAYRDSEISGAIIGTNYYNLSDATIHLCTLQIPCTWASVGGGGGGSAAGPVGTGQISNGSGTFVAGNTNDNALFPGYWYVGEPTCNLGPNPWVDTCAYGMRSVLTDFTVSATTTASSTAVTLSGANVGSFRNGDNIMIPAAGPTNSLATPAAPTVVASMISGIDTLKDGAPASLGSTTYNYCIRVRDAAGGFSSCSATGSTTTGAATLGPTSPASVSNWSRSGQTVTVTGISPSVPCAVGMFIFAQNSTDVTFSGQFQVASCNGGSTAVVTNNLTYTQGYSSTVPIPLQSGGNSTNAATGGTITPYNTNLLTLPTLTGAGSQYYIYTAGGAFRGISRPGETTWADFGAPAPTLDAWYPATSSAAAQAADNYEGTIVSGGGTANVAVTPAPNQSVSGVTAYFDNAANLSAACAAATSSGPLRITNGAAGTSYFLDYPVTCTGGPLAVIDAGILTVNETLTLSLVNWDGTQGGEPCGDPAFAFKRGECINVGGAYPGVALGTESSVVATTMDVGLNGLGMTVGAAGAGFNTTFVNFNCAIGSTDLVGQCLVLYGQSGVIITDSLFSTNNSSGYGYSPVPLFLSKTDLAGANGAGSITFNNPYFVGRGFGSESNPLVSADASFLIRHPYGQDVVGFPMFVFGPMNQPLVDLEVGNNDSSKVAMIGNYGGSMVLRIKFTPNNSGETSGRPGIVTGNPIPQFTATDAGDQPWLNSAAPQLGQNLTMQEGAQCWGIWMECTPSTTYRLQVNGNSYFNGYLDLPEIAAPANPGSGVERWYPNSSTHQLSCVTSSGGNCNPSGGGSGTVNNPNGAFGQGQGIFAANNGVGIASTPSVLLLSSITAHNAQQSNSGASIASAGTTITCSSCTFSSADVGKAITLGVNGVGPGTGGAVYVSTIASFVSTHVVNGTATAGTTNLTGNNIEWGTPDATIINNAISTMSANGGGEILIPCRNSASGDYYIDAMIQTFPNVNIRALGSAGEGSIGQDCIDFLPAGNVTTVVQIGIGTSQQFQAPTISNLAITDLFSQVTNCFLVNGASNGVFDKTMVRGCNATGAGSYRYTFGGGSTQTSTWAMNDARAYDCTICVDAGLSSTADGPMIDGGEYFDKNTNANFSGTPIAIRGAAVGVSKRTHIIVGQNAASSPGIGVQIVTGGSAANVQPKIEGTSTTGIGVDFLTSESRGGGFYSCSALGVCTQFESGASFNIVYPIDIGSNTQLVNDLSGNNSNVVHTQQFDLGPRIAFASLPSTTGLPNNATLLVVDCLTAACTAGGGTFRVEFANQSGTWTPISGSSGGGPGTGTANAVADWATSSTLGSIVGSVTGQSLTSTNGSAPSFVSPGVQDGNGGAVVTSSGYTIQCDSSTALIDRVHILRFQSGASAPVVPLSTAAGCTGGFAVTVIDDGAGSLVFGRTSTDTFSVFNGLTAVDSATSFTLLNGQYATLTQGASGIWEVREGLIPTGIPIGNVGSAGLSATLPLTIASSGAIATTSLTGFRFGNAGAADTVATATQASTLIQGLTGCNTANFVFTPQANDCVAQSGGVSSFSGDGTFATNSSSTGAVTLTLGTAGAHKWWGNNTGTTAAPGYETIGTADLPTGIPIANIGTSGLSATLPISITSAGAISTTSLTGIRFGNASAADTVATSAQIVSACTGCATSGANSNITSLTGLTTALSAGQGGTGELGTLTGILYGNASSAHTVATAAQLGTLFGSYIATVTGCTTANFVYVPATPACVAQSGGTPAYPLTITGGTSGGVVYGNNATQLTVSPAGTQNVLMKWGGAANPPTNSSVTDNGTTVATAEEIAVTQTAGTGTALAISNSTAATSSTAQSSPFDIRTGTAWYNPEFDTTSPPVAAASVNDCWSHQIVETNGSNGASIYNIPHNGTAGCVGSPGPSYLQTIYNESWGVQTNTLSTPTSPTVAEQGTSGSTDWSYTIAACIGPTCTSTPTATQITNGNATLGTSNWNKVTWSAVTNTDFYKVYRTQAAGTPSTTGAICLIPAGATLECDDKALTADGTAVPSFNATGQVYVGTGPVTGGGTGGGMLGTNGTVPSTLVSTASGWYANSTNACFDVVNGTKDEGCGLTLSGSHASVFTTSTQSIATTTFTAITSLLMPTIPASATVRGVCTITWEQAVAASNATFGIANSVAPTHLYITAIPADSAFVTPTYTSTTATTATAITGALTGSTSAFYQVTLQIMLQNSTSADAVQIYVESGSTSDAVVIQPGSSCGWLP